MKAYLRATLVVAVWLNALAAIWAQAASQPGSVVAWGDNSFGQCNVPFGLTNAVALAGGGNHSLAVMSDGTVVAWGDNSSGQTNVPSHLTNAIAVAGGYAHSLALKGDGTVVAWGNNSSGPGQTNVPPGLNGVKAIAAGWAHSLALKNDGRVVAWGQNYYGQANVPASLTNAVAIAAGSGHSLALKSDGTVVAWGEYHNGTSLVPMTVPVGLSNVAAISSFGGPTTFSFNAALKSNGTVVAWGNLGGGQTNLAPDLTKVSAIAAGFDYRLALMSDSTVVTWGQASSPTGLTNIVTIAGGSSHSLAIAIGPVIAAKPPTPIQLAHGSDTNLTISVRSGSPFNCQWKLNGLPIEGASNTSLAITRFDLSKAGVYSAFVSNPYGHASVATLIRLTNSPVVLVQGVDVGGGKVDRIDSAQVTMTNTGSGAAIFFTLDGSEPDFTDIPYTGPFTLTNSATIRAIAYNFAFTDAAEAAPITVQVWPTYPLAATTPGGGSIGLLPAPYSAGNRYVSNTVVTLTATPASNWSFLGWTGDSSATSNVTSVLMDQARTVTGVFGTALNLFTNGSGQVQLNPPAGPYAFGSTVQLTALPAPGYYFFGWANAASGFGNPLSFTVTNAAGLTANFGALAGNQVSLVVLPNGNGRVSVSPAKNVYTNGEPVALTAWPAANQTFTGWSGGAAGNLNPLVLALTNSTLLTANFAPGAPTNPPVITQPPLSRTLSAGADTLLSFALTGDGPFSYQWSLNSSPIPGATNPTLNLVGITPADAGRYEIAVIGSGGAVTSAPASVALFGMQLIPSGGSPLPLLILDGAVGTEYQLETSPNFALSNWSLLAPVTLTGTRFYYADTASSNQPARFYRAVPQ